MISSKLKNKLNKVRMQRKIKLPSMAVLPSKDFKETMNLNLQKLYQDTKKIIQTLEDEEYSSQTKQTVKVGGSRSSSESSDGGSSSSQSEEESGRQPGMNEMMSQMKNMGFQGRKKEEAREAGHPSQINMEIQQKRYMTLQNLMLISQCPSLNMMLQVI
ncbi:UNKNOWN [Stylonychia lemnae]|uniref:Uncharacterized protein n=1 Tax=Stylonychia lemnae TaxID=5949 RepID=A0A077ZQ71_STYLE|nr:UNKNOWN [Stylonychia lemnae]|eukprot:CDW72053.1 UNKNOWN [Stylonychia lemnae]